MKYVTCLASIIISIPVLPGHTATLSPKQQSSISPDLAAAIQIDPVDTEYHVLVRMSDGNEMPQRLSDLAASASTLRDRYQKVGAGLRALAAGAVPLVSGRSSVLRRFWITNAVEMRVDRTALLELAGRDDVTMVAPNVAIELLDPASVADAVSAAGAGANLQAIGARTAWARGLTGKGRLVASIDTGVEGIHPALKDRWRGIHGDTVASWFDPLDGPAPMDNNGHGTHVMGIMVGRDGADTIGLAPDAEWICAAVVDRGRSLSATFADILAALQWVVDPDGDPGTMDDVPDAVCNSWGVSQQIISPCDKFFFEAIDNVEAMGVVCIFAAGNEGPHTMSIRNPADRATTPTASFSVGAVDATTDALNVPGFSSRGPSACDGSAKKPEIAAPGVSIRSSYKGQTYKLINGTSMAAPHVAAAVALIRQYNPELTPEQIKTALLSTARDIDAPGEDNASGRGMIDLPAAIASLPSATYPVVTSGESQVNAGYDGVAALGETIELVVPVTIDVAAGRDITLSLSSICPQATVASGSVYLGTIPAGGTASNASAPFVVDIASNASAGDTVRLEVRMSGDPLLNWWRDTVAVRVGLPDGAGMTTAASGASALTLSNFGQFGLGENSAINAGGAGWHTSMIDANILYEGALMVASADGGWADASRRDEGFISYDFTPNASYSGDALCFADEKSTNPVGVMIDQTALPVYQGAAYDITTVVWTVHNTRATAIPGFQLGLLVDMDLPTVEVVSEQVAVDQSTGGFYHMALHSEFVAGLALLSGPFGGLNFYENFGSKQTLSTSTKKQAISTTGIVPDESSDYFAIAATRPVDIAAGASIPIAVAFIAATDPASFSAAAVDARDRWLLVSDIDDGVGGGVVPSDFRLEQNYPNPFNAGTTIPVQIATSSGSPTRLDVYDLLGRRVRTLMNEVKGAGTYSVFWDGRNDDGVPLASGVYFARLSAPGQGHQVRSMVLVK